MAERLDAIIVGAGIAGLAAARRLSSEGCSVAIFDAADAIGGRVRTDERDGFLLDRGFQTVCPAYPALADLVDRLDLRPFHRGIGVLANGRLHHLAAEPSAVSALRTRLLSLRDAAALTRLATLDGLGPVGRYKHRVDRPAHDELRAAGLSERAIDMVLRPFLSGVFGEDMLTTSGRYLHLLLRSFLRGGAALPSGGMRTLPRLLAAGLSDESIVLGARVTSVAPGVVQVGSYGQVRAGAVIVATDASTAAGLLPGITSPAWHGLTTFYYATDTLSGEPALLLVDADQPTIVRNAVVVSAAAPSYAPPGAQLVAASVLGEEVNGAFTEVELRVRARLAALYRTATANWELLASYPIAHALPAMDSPHPLRRRVRVGDGLYVCGDHRDTSSIQGALVSGHRAAAAALTDLSLLATPALF
jgi:phytoene dehydrogenase-like protein